MNKKPYVMKAINTLLGIVMVWLVSTSVQANLDNCPSVYKVTVTQLNIRNQPKKPSKILGTVSLGDKVCVSNFNGNWAKIEDGWVSSKYLKLIEQDAVETRQTNMSDVDKNTNNVYKTDESDGFFSRLGIIGVVILVLVVGTLLVVLAFWSTVFLFHLVQLIVITGITTGIIYAVVYYLFQNHTVAAIVAIPTFILVAISTFKRMKKDWNKPGSGSDGGCDGGCGGCGE